MEEIPKGMAYLLGLISADGGLYRTTKNGFQVNFVSDSSVEFCRFIKELASKCLKLPKNRVKISKHTIFNCWYVYVFSKRIYNFISHLGISEGRKSSIKIPKIIKKNQDLLRWYLRGVFDGEGSVVVSRKRTEKKIYEYPRILIKISDKTWINELFNALKLLQIVCRKFEYPERKRYEIHINGYSQVKRFGRIIGSCHPSKRKKLSVYAA